MSGWIGAFRQFEQVHDVLLSAKYAFFGSYCPMSSFPYGKEMVISRSAL
jgi:hypothetical protein